jgi:hypothetical protein
MVFSANSLRPGVRDARHAGGDRALQLLILTELPEPEGFQVSTRWDLDRLTVSDDPGSDHVFPEDVSEVPGDRVTQGVGSSRLPGGNTPSPGDGRVGAIELANPLAHGDVGEARGEPHPVEDRHAVGHRLLLEPSPVLVQSPAGCDCQALRLMGVRVAVVILEYVHDVEAGGDGVFDALVVGLAVAQRQHPCVVLPQQRYGRLPVGNVQRMGDDLRAANPAPDSFQGPRTRADKPHTLHLRVTGQVPGHGRTDAPRAADDHDPHRTPPVRGRSHLLLESSSPP